MHLFFNELSLQHQCPTQDAFNEAVQHIMRLRRIALKYERRIYCHRQITAIEVSPSKSMQQAVQQLDMNIRRAFMQWITATGPFWDDDRQHSPGEYFELDDGTIITDTGLGEAAYRVHNDEPSSTVSFTNDTWGQDYVSVRWHTTDDIVTIKVDNYHAHEHLDVQLERIDPPPTSWDDLHTRCSKRIEFLTFVENCNDDMQRYPFSVAVANQIYSLLNMLNRFAAEHDEQGKRTATGQMYYQDWFTGNSAYFTDESDSNTPKYAQQLTFTLPDGNTALCGMHAKPNTPKNFPPIRIHFSWPLDSTGHLCIVYTGKKITMD